VKSVGAVSSSVEQLTIRMGNKTANMNLHIDFMWTSFCAG
jgi:hypothetical protein